MKEREELRERFKGLEGAFRVAVEGNRDGLKTLTSAVEDVATVIVGAEPRGLSSDQREFFKEMKREFH